MDTSIFVIIGRKPSIDIKLTRVSSRSEMEIGMTETTLHQTLLVQSGIGTIETTVFNSNKCIYLQFMKAKYKILANNDIMGYN